MDNPTFKQEYLSVFAVPDEHYKYAFRKWLEYYYQTEEYDRKVCRGFDNRTQEAVPTNGFELASINRNEKKIMNETVLDLRERNIPEETWRVALNDVSRYSHERIKELLKR